MFFSLFVYIGGKPKKALKQAITWSIVGSSTPESIRLFSTRLVKANSITTTPLTFRHNCSSEVSWPDVSADSSFRKISISVLLRNAVKHSSHVSGRFGGLGLGNLCSADKATAFLSPWTWECMFWQPIFRGKNSFPQALPCDVAWFLPYFSANTFCVVDIVIVAVVESSISAVVAASTGIANLCFFLVSLICMTRLPQR